ncbi:hypothetical protein NMY22_g16737 [Coprinellus aureogranulatus]|nr:hypothetical protein NMY22_g16737 [Coprinellus aureogranulatus]
MAHLDAKKRERDEQQRNSQKRRARIKEDAEKLRQEQVEEEEVRRAKAEKKREKRRKRKLAEQKRNRRIERKLRSGQDRQKTARPVATTFIQPLGEILLLQFRKVSLRFWRNLDGGMTDSFPPVQHISEYDSLKLSHIPVFAYPRGKWASRLKKGRTVIANAEEERASVHENLSPAIYVASQPSITLSSGSVGRMERASRTKDKGWTKEKFEMRLWFKVKEMHGQKKAIDRMRKAI